MDQSLNPTQSMQAWLETSLGAYFTAWEQSRLDSLLVDIFGYNALQVGLSPVDLLRASRMPLHVCAAQQTHASLAVPCDGAALPFASTSLDLVVLAHTLEFSDDPHQLLREAGRVLVADGSLVACGFNPYSLWACRRSRDQWPWYGKYLSASRVHDWLNVLGFEVQCRQFGCYAPAVDSPKWLARWKWLDALGKRCWPVCGAVWMLHGIKRVRGARLIQPNWREKGTHAKSLSAVARKLGNVKKTDETWK